MNVSTAPDAPAPRETVKIFLCGDVMLGRGIDQVLPHPCAPGLRESYANSATDYVRLAEQANGPIPTPVDGSYVWGASLEELKRARPDARIVNLETSVTRSENYVEKGINYRMSPENAECLSAAGIQCCVLANNHILDWGHAGLVETLATLARLGIRTAGAGRNLAEASAPAVLDTPGKGRVIVFSFASVTSGTPRSWAATSDLAGVNLVTDLSPASAGKIVDQVARARRPGDIVVVSFHWGPNWGYQIARDQRRFAHGLIDHADVSVIHGHSSHHPQAIEVYRNRLILYGCGDYLNDYEGISGYQEFRGDLALMYFAEFDSASADLVDLEMVPLRIRRFQLIPASNADADWLRHTLDRECRRFGGRIALKRDGTLALSWPAEAKAGLRQL